MTFIDILISFVLALIMFGIGLSLRFQDFINIFYYPKSLSIGLVLQMILLPALAFGVGHWSGLAPAYQVGLVLLAACPGGTTSNFISYLMNANVALSIALTSVNSLITLISIPLLVNMAIQFFDLGGGQFSLPYLTTIAQIFLVVLVPAILGMLVKHYQNDFAEKASRYLKPVTVLALGLVIGIKLFAGEEEGGAGVTLAESLSLLPYTLGLHLLSLLLALAVGKAFSLDKPNIITICIEVGMQNTMLALLIGATLLGSEDVIKPALVYSVFSFSTVVGFALLLRYSLAAPTGR